MRCPRCGVEQPDAAECVSCGVIVAKVLARQSSAAATSAPPAAAAGRVTQPAPTTKPGIAAIPGVAAMPGLAATPDPPRPRKRAPLARATRHILLRELGEMVSQGVPLTQALASLEGAFRRGERARVTRDLAAALGRGGSLADAIDHAGFDRVEVALVRAAERSGALGPALARLAARLEVEQEVAAEIRDGLRQPVGMVLSAAVLLPAPIAIEHGFGAWFVAAATGVVVVVALGLAVVFGLPVLWQRPGLRGRLLALAEYLPGISTLVRRRRYALLFGVLAPALEAGVPLDEALLLGADAVAEPLVTDAIAGLAARVRSVGGLAEGARTLPGIDEETLGRLATGELGGGLAAVATERAATFTRRHAEALRVGARTLRTLLSALVMIAVSAAVATQLGKMVGDPMSMMPSSERRALEQELQRAMPQLQGAGVLPGLDGLDVDKPRRNKAKRPR